MASYAELHDLATNSEHASLWERIEAATVKKAQTLLDGGAPTADEVAWASNTLKTPKERAQCLRYYVLMANSGLSTAAILAASDAAVQSNIDAAADALIAGGVVG